MIKTKSTKRALLLSALSLLLCVSMLVGSTFAWFTDSVTSAGNIIKSGTLQVEMHWADGTKAVPAVDSTDWTDASAGAIFNYDLWEPGYTEVRHIKIENKGTLALKYQLNIVANGEVSELADVIDVYYADPAAQVADRTALVAENKIGTLSQVLANMSSSASGNLEAGQNHTITLALKMQESANNDYQDLAIGSDFSVQLMATQLTSEEDSFDEQYDKMATADSVEELAEALEADYDLITLGANIELPDVTGYAAKQPTATLTIPADKTLTIDLNGYTMSQAYTQTGAYAMIENKGTLTIKDSVGTGKLSYKDIGAGGEYASNTIRNEGTLNVRGGTIENVSSDALMSVGYPHAIDVYQGSTTNIYDGTVKSANYDCIRMFCNSETLATTVNIYGGTIINRVSFQDPATNRAGYGVLNISGGEFITTNGVTANVRLLNFSKVTSNMKATVTGGTFDKGFKTQDIASCGVNLSDWLTSSISAPVSNAADLAAALTAGGNVALTDDLSVNGAVITNNGVTEAYGNPVGFAQYGGVLDGNGKTLEGTDYKTYLVVTHGGTIKNLSMDIGFRGIATYTPTEDVILDNVNICGDIAYPINTLEPPTVDGIDLIVTNSKLGGWASFAGMETASFTNCEFDYGCYYSSYPYNSLVKPYINTTFTDCEFAGGYYIDLSALEDGCTVTLKNCTVDGVKLTAENFAQYLVAEDDYVEGQAKLVVEKREGGYMTAESLVDYIIFQ